MNTKNTDAKVPWQAYILHAVETELSQEFSEANLSDCLSAIEVITWAILEHHPTFNDSLEEDPVEVFRACTELEHALDPGAIEQANTLIHCESLISYGHVSNTVVKSANDARNQLYDYFCSWLDNAES